MHIAIEGMDGVGKTTTCKLLAERLGYTFVEKPLSELFCEGDINEYIKIRDKVNASENRLYTAWFYGLSNVYLYERYKGNIVTDRHILSNYAWSGTDDNKEIYDLLVAKLGVPKLTVILYAPSDVIYNRLKTRDVNDSDLCKAEKSGALYEKMVYFCEVYKCPYMVVDTTNSAPEEIVNRIVMKYKSMVDVD